MRTIPIIILVLIYTFSNAQENISGQHQNELGETLILNSDKTFENYNEIEGKIINEILLTPHCGYIAFATVIEFEIINSDLKNYEHKSIPIIIKCPEFYKENFFNKKNTYKIKITNNSGTEFGWNIPNLKISENYKLGREFWSFSIEKI